MKPPVYCLTIQPGVENTEFTPLADGVIKAITAVRGATGVFTLKKNGAAVEGVENIPFVSDTTPIVVTIPYTGSDTFEMVVIGATGITLMQINVNYTE